MNKLLTWAVTLGMAMAAGIVAYAQVAEGPPETRADLWKLLVVTLTTAGFGGGARMVNKGLDKAAAKRAGE